MALQNSVVPESDLPEVPQSAVPSHDIPESIVPENDLPNDYGSATEMAKTAVEQGLSGLTLGGSKVLETKLLGIKPEAIAGREEANPVTSLVGNLAGTVGLIGATGGLGGLAEGAGAATKIGVGALEGAGIGATNQATDDWSKNKALDAQRIAASGGLGALLGGLGTAAVEGFKAKLGSSPAAADHPAPPSGPSAPPGVPPETPVSASVLDAPEIKGTKGMDLSEMEAKLSDAHKNGTVTELPQRAELEDALSRIGMENPVNPAQLDSVGNQGTRNIYQVAKETPGGAGDTIKGYEALQKAELVSKTEKAIQDIAPEHIPIPDAVKGGEQAIDAFTEQYQAEKKALAPLFENMKGIKLQGEILPDTIGTMVKVLPEIANMIKVEDGGVKIAPYLTRWGIDKATYTAVKDAVESLKDSPNDLDSLWKIRKGLDQNIDVTAKGSAANEIGALKKALMTQMQEASGNPELKEAFKRYAINEDERKVIEKSFGASVGSPEFGAISKVKPEMIGDKIFSNTANVTAAKNILEPKEFNKILANWISEAKAKATDKGAFSSNKFGRFLRTNQDALNVAFAENPVALQRLHDMTTIMRILPDAPSINPSGTAKTLFQMMKGANLHDMTWEGMIATLPKKVLGAINDHLQMNELNKALEGRSAISKANSALKKSAEETSDKIGLKVRDIFRHSGSGVSSESRRMRK